MEIIAIRCHILRLKLYLIRLRFVPSLFVSRLDGVWHYALCR